PTGREQTSVARPRRAGAGHPLEHEKTGIRTRKMRGADKILPPARGDHLRMPDEHIAQLLADARNGSAAALGRAIDGCRGYLLLIAGQELDARIRSKVASSDGVQATLL